MHIKLRDDDVAAHLVFRSQKVLVRGTGERTRLAVHQVGIVTRGSSILNAQWSATLTARMLRDDLGQQADGGVKVVPPEQHTT